MNANELDPAGLRAARRYVGWHLGDKQWADDILHAYFNPEQANDELDEEISNELDRI